MSAVNPGRSDSAGPAAHRPRPRVRLAAPARAGLAFGAIAVSGLVALVLAWYGVSGTVDLSNQMAYTVSGGAGGLALVVTGATLLASHVGRCLSAREDAALEQVLCTLSSMAEEIRS